MQEFNDWNYRGHEQPESNVKVIFPETKRGGSPASGAGGREVPKVMGISYWLMPSFKAEEIAEKCGPKIKYTKRLIAKHHANNDLLPLDEDIKPASVMEAVVKFTGVSEADIISFKRTRNLVKARQMAMKLIRGFKAWPYERIGEMFGRDHSTIIHAIRAADAHIKFEAEYRNLYNKIKQALLNQ